MRRTPASSKSRVDRDPSELDLQPLGWARGRPGMAGPRLTQLRRRLDLRLRTHLAEATFP